MITSQEYIRNSDLRRDFLSAFSAMDHSVTEGMELDEIQTCFDRLVFRLLAICELHGPGAAKNFIHAIVKAEPKDFIGIAIAFVEIGKQPTTDTERETVRRRELQQEILHFSRIVDLRDGEVEPQNKRLRNSKLIPEGMKVLCEFLTVVRGRVLQRGKAVQTPRARPDQQVNYQWGSEFLLIHDREASDYVAVIAGGSLQVQKELAFLFASLLTYLTPRESLTALTVHLLEALPDSGSVAFALLEPMDGSGLRVTQWSPCPMDGVTSSDRLVDCMKSLSEQYENQDGAPCTLFSQQGQVVASAVPAEALGITILDLAKPESPGRHQIKLACPDQTIRSKEATIEAAGQLFQSRCDAPITSIESGHIHLDRQIDEDQAIGSAIGNVLFRQLAAVQNCPPRLNPMVDDDHVLVQLAAKDYEAFFRAEHPGAPFELIPESSPIVRTIACCLLAHVSSVPAKKKRFLMQGNNLVLKVPEENILCELFEDFHGKCDTGCVLFEVALLIYRSDPDYFSQAFHNYFHLKADVHQRILAALDPVQPHDAIIEELKAYGAQFKEALDPHHPCPFFMDLVGAFLARVDHLYVHLNVLEDYYEAQQFKVRRLLRFMGVPLQLWSLHFNRLTGRVHLERRVQPREE